MIVDIFTHVVPAAFLDRLGKVAPNLADMDKQLFGGNAGRLMKTSFN